MNAWEKLLALILVIQRRGIQAVTRKTTPATEEAYYHALADLHDFLDRTPIHELMRDLEEAMEPGMHFLAQRYGHDTADAERRKGGS